MHENNTEISQKKLITNQQLGESQDKRAELQEGEKEDANIIPELNEKLQVKIERCDEKRNELKQTKELLSASKSQLRAKHNTLIEKMGQLKGARNEKAELEKQIKNLKSLVKNKEEEIAQRGNSTKRGAATKRRSNSRITSTDERHAKSNVCKRARYYKSAGSNIFKRARNCQSSG